MKYKASLILPIIVLIAIALRYYGIDWDQGQHLHPDERMLILVAEKVDFFSNLNPDFFNYGSLPIYLLRGASEVVDPFHKENVATYAGMLGVGRVLSIFFDVLTVILVYKIARLLFKHKQIALFSSLFYAIAFFPIQNAHFFIVDPILTFFLTATIYSLMLYVKKPSYLKIILIALFAAGAITTKFTGILILPIVGLGILLAHISVQTVNHKKFKQYTSYFILHTSYNLLLFAICALLFAFIFMPYGFINYDEFAQQISQQLKMNSDAFIFPYTLQYVNTTTYWYYLKNIFLWGLGPIISSLALLGGIMATVNLVQMIRAKQFKLTKKATYFILYTSYFILFFLVLGKSSVKFMRYMLPLYPYLTILAGYGAYKISGIRYQILERKISIGYIVVSIMLIGSFLWTLMFMSIYTQEHTRIQASKWIYRNIPSGSTLAVEHWDDRLPLAITLNTQYSTFNNYNSNQYQYEELEIYNPDSQVKWEIIDKQLDNADYIVISSNRLYTPLMKLTDCTNLPSHRCYPLTAKYYDELFNEELGFTKVAEFTSYPKLVIGHWSLVISDEGADESFTVYDHPKVMIYKKIKKPTTPTSFQRHDQESF